MSILPEVISNPTAALMYWADQVKDVSDPVQVQELLDELTTKHPEWEFTPLATEWLSVPPSSREPLLDVVLASDEYSSTLRQVMIYGLHPNIEPLLNLPSDGSLRRAAFAMSVLKEFISVHGLGYLSHEATNNPSVSGLLWGCFNMLQGGEKVLSDAARECVVLSVLLVSKGTDTLPAPVMWPKEHLSAALNSLDPEVLLKLPALPLRTTMSFLCSGHPLTGCWVMQLLGLPYERDPDIEGVVMQSLVRYARSDGTCADVHAVASLLRSMPPLSSVQRETFNTLVSDTDVSAKQIITAMR